MGQIHCHKLVYETAVGMAHELYSTLMSDNFWYDLWKSQNPELSSKALEELFVKRNLPRLVAEARATLAGMLGRLDVPEQTKRQIFDALEKDHLLRRGRDGWVRAKDLLSIEPTETHGASKPH